MKIIEQSWSWLQKPPRPLELIERAGRTCYQSEERIGPGTSEKFARMLVSRGHESVIEHCSASIRFITNRGVTHELVRHRLASYSQESTRYVRYDRMEFIQPVWWNTWSPEEQQTWLKAMETAESCYRHLLESGSSPEQAREVLPQSLKTEIVMTANLREWRSVFHLRCSQAAHPQIRVLMRDCLRGFAREIPVLFEDLAEKFSD